MRRTVIVLCAFALGSAAAGAAVADEALDQLVKNARYWQERGRGDKVVEAWTRVLAADANHGDALAALGAFHARRGRAEKARELLARLQAAHPRHPGIAVLEQALATGGRYDELLAQARKQAKAGATVEAIAAYKRAFGSDTPPDDVALEYYQTLGGTPDGWEAARVGLEALVARGGNGPARIALATHLTYREKSRRKGVALLQALATAPGAGADVRKAWRQALVWLQATAADAELLAAYLAVAPGDAEIAKRLDDVRRAGVRAPAAAPDLKPGFDALERGDLEQADRVFKAGRGRAREVDVLVGEGLLALRREDFATARDIFLKVKAMAPGRPESWKRPLDSATFWALMREAETLRRDRRLDEAEKKLAEAAAASQDERVHADLRLVDLHIEREAVAEAEALLQKLRAQHPEDANVVASLVRFYLATDRAADAAAANEELRRIDADKAFRPEQIESEVLRAQAAASRKLGDIDEARAALSSARASDAKNPWVLHDLAYVLLDLDDTAAARAIVEELAALDPGTDAARGRELKARVAKLRARVLDTEGQYRAALTLIDTLAPAELDEDTRLTRSRLEVQAQVADIVARARQGSLAGSRLRLVDLQRRTKRSPELSALVALAWADLGDAERAVALAAEMKQRASRSGPGLRLTLAAVYLRAGRDAELEGLLRELGAETSLSPRERRDLTRLRIAHVVRGADKLREAGDLETAVGRLAAVLQEHPENPRLLCGLGRVFHDAREHGEGRALFQRVLNQDPGDLEARQGAIQTALGTHDRAGARRLIDEGLARDPDNARMHLIAGRFAVQTGADADAMAAFRRARVLAEKDIVPAAPSLSVASALLRKTAPSKDGDGRLSIEIDDEIDKLEAKRSVDVGAEFELRNRRGYGGFSGIIDLRVPVHATVPLGFWGRLTFTVAPTMLDAGKVNFSRAETVEQFGLLGLDATRVPSGPFAGAAGGASLGLAYTHKGFSGDVGTTPLGMPLATGVGGLSFRHQIGRVGLAAEASRRSVTDSVLSYVGAADPVSGERWGRVLRQGARLDLSVSTDVALLYAIGATALLTGYHVPENHMYMLGGGTEWKLHEHDTTSVISGVGMTYLGYDRNLRYATYGHGGYFSPQQFFHAGALFKWQGRAGDFGYETKADVGVNWFRESGAAFYPRDPRLQSARSAQVDMMGAPVRAWHQAQTNVALAVDAAARGSYRVSRQLEAGFQLGYRSADWFQEIVAGAYVQLNLRRKKP